MSSITFYIFFILFLALVLLAVNLLLAPNNPYQEKDSAFECGFHSFLGQNRTQFSISFFVFALLFLLFDLEILLVYPYVVSAYSNSIYGLVIMLTFFLILTLGFAFELGKKALNIDTRQSSSDSNNNRVFNVKYTLKNFFTISKRTFSTSYKRGPALIANLAFYLNAVISRFVLFTAIPSWIFYFINIFIFYLNLFITTSRSNWNIMSFWDRIIIMVLLIPAIVIWSNCLLHAIDTFSIVYAGEWPTNNGGPSVGGPSGGGPSVGGPSGGGNPGGGGPNEEFITVICTESYEEQDRQDRSEVNRRKNESKKGIVPGPSQIIRKTWSYQITLNPCATMHMETEATGPSKDLPPKL